MNRRTAFILAFALLTVGFFYLLYCYFDLMVSLSYSRAEYLGLKSRQNLLYSLILRTGKDRNRTQWLALLKRDFGKEHLVKEDGNNLSCDEVLLMFDEKRLVKVDSAEGSVETK